MSQAKRTFSNVLRWILIGFGLLFLSSITLRIYEEIRYRHVLPPSHVKNIQGFRQWSPSSRKAQVVTFQGSTYYAVRGPLARFVASGPSEYYFDHKGNYVGRNKDIGDFYEPAIFFFKEARREPIEIGSIPTNSP